LTKGLADEGALKALTLRELHVVNFVALGLSNRDISRGLGIAEGVPGYRHTCVCRRI
jgi:DNA-binding NarL/FixJ family response regulator